MPTRTELKAYTLAGYVPFFDEFGEDVFVDLGKMFLEDFTEAYGQEFDRQCLIADNDPFKGAMNMTHAEKHVTSSADISQLSYLDFRAAELKVEPEERKYCKWFMNETVLNHITNIRDDNNNPIWRKPWEGMPGRLDGYDVIESRLLPQFSDIKANSSFAIFMTQKKSYTVTAKASKSNVLTKRQKDLNTASSLYALESVTASWLPDQRKIWFCSKQQKNNISQKS